MDKNRKTILVVLAVVVVIVLVRVELATQDQGARDVTWDDLMSIDKDAAEIAMSLEETETVKIQSNGIKIDSTP